MSPAGSVYYAWACGFLHEQLKDKGYGIDEFGKQKQAELEELKQKF